MKLRCQGFATRKMSIAKIVCKICTFHFKNSSSSLSIGKVAEEKKKLNMNEVSSQVHFVRGNNVCFLFLTFSVCVCVCVCWRWFDADIQSYSLFLELFVGSFVCYISLSAKAENILHFEEIWKFHRQTAKRAACRFHSDAYVNWEPHNEMRCVLYFVMLSCCTGFEVVYACFIFIFFSSFAVFTENEERNNQIQLQSIIWFSFHEGEHLYSAAVAIAAAIVYLMCFLSRIIHCIDIHICIDGILNDCLIRIKYKQSSICYG